MGNYIHVGGKIEELLEEQHKTKRELADDIDMSASNVVYLCGKESMDVQMLHKIGNALKYNFFKHYVIDDGKPKSDAVSIQSTKVIEEKQQEIEALKNQLSEKEKLFQNLEREFTMMKQENGYLKEINELLKGNKQKK